MKGSVKGNLCEVWKATEVWKSMWRIEGYMWRALWSMESTVKYENRCEAWKPMWSMESSVEYENGILTAQCDSGWNNDAASKSMLLFAHQTALWCVHMLHYLLIWQHYGVYTNWCVNSAIGYPTLESNSAMKDLPSLFFYLYTFHLLSLFIGNFIVQLLLHLLSL